MVHDFDRPRAQVVLIRRAVAVAIDDLNAVTFGVVDDMTGLPGGICLVSASVQRVVLKAGRVAIGVGDRQQIAHGVVGDRRDIPDRVGPFDAVPDGVVLIARRVTVLVRLAEHVAVRVVCPAFRPAQRVGHARPIAA